MTLDWLHVLTIFKCDCNVGGSIIIYLFDDVEITITTDMYY